MAVFAFYGLSVVLACAAWRTAGLGLAFLPLAVLFAAQLAWQAARLKLTEPARALALFKSNTWAGLILLAAIIAGK